MLGRACASLPLALLGACAASGLELYSELIADTGPPETLGTGQCLPCEGLFLRLEEAPDGKLQQSSQIEMRGWVQCGTVCVFVVSTSGSGLKLMVTGREEKRRRDINFPKCRHCVDGGYLLGCRAPFATPGTYTPSLAVGARTYCYIVVC